MKCVCLPFCTGWVSLEYGGRILDQRQQNLRPENRNKNYTKTISEIQQINLHYMHRGKAI